MGGCPGVRQHETALVGRGGGVRGDGIQIVKLAIGSHDTICHFLNAFNGQFPCGLNISQRLAASFRSIGYINKVFIDSDQRIQQRFRIRFKFNI